MKTLWCETGKHNFEHPGGRGRPPKNCPEHRPEKNVKPVTVETGVTATEAVTVEKQPDLSTNPFIIKAQRAKMEKMRERKTEVASEREQRTERERREALLAEFKTIDERVEAAYRAYDAQLKLCKTVKTEDTMKAFNKLDSLQKSAVNMSARQRMLKSLFESGVKA